MTCADQRHVVHRAEGRLVKLSGDAQNAQLQYNACMIVHAPESVAVPFFQFLYLFVMKASSQFLDNSNSPNHSAF